MAGMDQINPGFAPDFATPAEWATMYRECGLQVVPAKLPIKGGEWKMPALIGWAEFQENLIPQETFERWYGANGQHVGRQNMGILTGHCSGNVMVIDLDDHKTPAAQAWWHELIEAENHGIEPETVEQLTGGGGRQKLFRAPADWHCPTNRTSIGVDIRGQGGFAMMPCSVHESGRSYVWAEGHAPWEISIAAAQPWLLDAIEMLVQAHGGNQGDSETVPHERTASPDTDIDAFGNTQDGREIVMRDVVWHQVLQWYRECPIQPPQDQWKARAREAYELYELKVVSRIAGVALRDGLEQERRGPTAFWRKWRATMRNWGSPRMVDSAAKPKPDMPVPDPTKQFQQASAKVETKAKTNPGALFEYLTIEQILALPPPKWLVEKLVIEQAVGFIFGPPGSLKTFIALDMAMSIATSKSTWWDYNVARHGGVIYILNEGVLSVPYRLKVWEQHRQTPIAGVPFRLVRQSINFMQAQDVGKLLATVQAIVDETGPVVAVFVDTVSRVLPGAKENQQEDMSLFIAACDAVKDRFGATVIGVHHTNYAGGFRGSTVMPAAGAFLIETRREPGAMTGSIYALKVKDGEDGWERFFTVNKIILGDMVATTSLVVDGIDVRPKPPDESSGEWPSRDTCKQILAALDEEWMNSRPWCYSKNSPRNAVNNIMLRWHIDRKTVERLLERWHANGVIAEEVRDSKNHVKGYHKLLDL